MGYLGLLPTDNSVYFVKIRDLSALRITDSGGEFYQIHFRWYLWVTIYDSEPEQRGGSTPC